MPQATRGRTRTFGLIFGESLNKGILNLQAHIKLTELDLSLSPCLFFSNYIWAETALVTITASICWTWLRHFNENIHFRLTSFLSKQVWWITVACQSPYSTSKENRDHWNGRIQPTQPAHSLHCLQTGTSGKIWFTACPPCPLWDWGVPSK